MVYPDFIDISTFKDLSNLSLVALKELAKDVGLGRVSKYKAADKPQFANEILKKVKENRASIPLKNNTLSLRENISNVFKTGIPEFNTFIHSVYQNMINIDMPMETILKGTTISHSIYLLITHLNTILSNIPMRLNPPPSEEKYTVAEYADYYNENYGLLDYDRMPLANKKHIAKNLGVSDIDEFLDPSNNIILQQNPKTGIPIDFAGSPTMTRREYINLYSLLGLKRLTTLTQNDIMSISHNVGSSTLIPEVLWYYIRDPPENNLDTVVHNFKVAPSLNHSGVPPVVPPVVSRPSTKTPVVPPVVSRPIVPPPVPPCPPIPVSVKVKNDWMIKEDEKYSGNISIENITTDKRTEDVKKPENPLTVEYIEELVKNDAKFLDDIHKNLKYLNSAKSKNYTELRQQFLVSIADDEKVISALETTVSAKTIEEMFPMLPTYKVYVSKLESFLNSCKISMTKETLKANLLQAITDPKQGIKSLTGESRKFMRNELARKIYILSKGYKSFISSFNNMIFMGPAGVGKTKLANTVGYVCGKIGILLNGSTIVASPKDLIGSYVGQTAPKTSGVLLKGLENVLLIDEAYQLLSCKDGKISDGASFGNESITEIVNFLDKFVGMNITIVAGYKREIEGCFLASNEGLDRRFPIKWELPLYSPYELFSILMNEITKTLNVKIPRETALYVYSLISHLDKQNSLIFKNQAGDMINLAGLYTTEYYSSYDLLESNRDRDIIIFNQAFNKHLKSFKLKVKE